MTTAERTILTALAERLTLLRRMRLNPRATVHAIRSEADSMGVTLGRACDEIAKRLPQTQEQES